MNQGQHIMAGVRAASRRYYGSPRKGQGRRLGHHLAQIGRAASKAAQAFVEWADKTNGAFRAFAASLEQDDLVVLSAAKCHRKRHPVQHTINPAAAATASRLLDMLERKQ